VTLSTKVTFEYEVKPEDKLKTLKIDANNLKEIPF